MGTSGYAGRSPSVPTSESASEPATSKLRNREKPLLEVGTVPISRTRNQKSESRGQGKSDPLDAEAAARAVLPSVATATREAG